MKINKLIDLVGSPRSGSTLVYNSLCSSRIFNPGLPENHLVPNLVKYFIQQLKRNKKEKNLFFESNNDTLDYFKNYINIYHNKICQKYKTDKLLLKSIIFSSNIDAMNILLPDTKFIMIIRDPRDIITSMLRISEKQINQKIRPQYPRDMGKLSYFINPLKNSTISVKYEDFIINSVEILNKIMKNLNLSYTFKENDNLWDYSLNISKDEKNYFNSDLWNKPISKNKIGVYKNYLKAEEINEVNKNCEDIINKFNY